MDTSRKDALRDEAPGILRWLVEGALKWQKQGLKPSKAVVKASQRYRIERDQVNTFLQEQTRADASSSLGATELYVSFSRWCADQQLEPVSLKEFGEKVRKTYERVHTMNGNRYEGIAMKDEGRIQKPSLYPSSKKEMRKDLSSFMVDDGFVNVDHEPVEDDEIPEPTLKEQREQIEAQVEAYEEEQLRATAADWQMTPEEIQALLADGQI